MTNFISLSRVRKSYGDVEVLKGIDLEIGRGEFFSLLGPSGCGKTTLLRIIAGFEQVSGGSLMIDGASMARVPANKRPTNMVFQSYAVFPHLSVAQNVAFGLRRAGLGRAEKQSKVEAALEQVGLAGYGARAAHALSGGQRQRVALARALILKPKVLLLDEPLSALDKKLREEMQVELIKLQREVGITFILVTHDQEEALIMSDRIAVMFDGRIAQLADPETLYRHPATRRVASFIGTMNFLPAQVVELHGGGAAVLDVAGFGRCSVPSSQCPEGLTLGPISVGMRPETLTLLYGGEATGKSEVTGTVDEVVYYGDMTYYDIRLPGAEAPIRLSMRNVIGRDVLAVGTSARIAWDPRAMVLFPEPPT